MCSLRDDALVEAPTDGPGPAVLTTRWDDVRLPPASTALQQVLERMARELVPLSELEPFWSALPRELEGALQQVLVRSLAVGGGDPLLSVVPISRTASFRPVPPRPGALHRLSRFALMRSDGDGLCIESPLSGHRVALPGIDGVRLTGCFGRASTVEDTAAELHLPAGTVRAVVSYLLAAGMLVSDGSGPDEEPGRFAEDGDPALIAWSPHDLMLHSRSRVDCHDGAHGATYPYAGRMAPEPVVKPVVAHQRVPLVRPALDRLLAQDPPMTAVLEGRRSMRQYGTEPLTLRQLGELLFRVARIRSLGSAPDVAEYGAGSSSRPYPSIGSTYALELYLTVGDCEGLECGTYHYDPVEHALRAVATGRPVAGQLLSQTRLLAGGRAEPPALITITGRFRRMTWKYSGMAYTALLKDVGVLQQTLYLVCTAMGLASCATSGGDGDLFARAAGLDWRVESSVGGFALGSLPPAEAEPAAGGMPLNGYDWPGRSAEVLRDCFSRRRRRD